MDASALIPLADLGRSVPTLVFQSGWFAKFILLILFVISVISWAIIYDRTRLYMKLRQGGRRLQADLASKGLSLSMDTVRQCLPSVEGALLLETRRFLENRKDVTPSAEGSSASNPETVTARLSSLLERRAVAEVSEMEKYLVFLATTAGVAPFLGLLGTVWGIAGSFLSMGAHGTASIEVVGPGIAEALITTIAGLGAAIPAVVGYNLLLRHVRRQENRIELFAARLLELTAARSTERPYSGREASYEKKPV
ncbi:MAG: MotA/TolQ/ExbB proton channel family protein [Candidatus Latescibacterota bacterium]|nr:MAG: MotA/TolQ/ExbB proton channel family protein [Candidatus Latescibacterota bacterium]